MANPHEGLKYGPEDVFERVNFMRQHCDYPIYSDSGNPPYGRDDGDQGIPIDINPRDRNPGEYVQRAPLSRDIIVVSC